MKKIISGKVREVFDLEDGRMAIVTTDRISAFDVILPTLIPEKGRVLNSISNFWFGRTQSIVKNHLIFSEEKDFPKEFQSEEFLGRCVIVKKLKMIPYEVIVRGYMFGSMFEAYKKTGEFLGVKFDRHYEKAERLSEPIVTPSTKAASGHDENIPLSKMKADLGEDLESKIERAALEVYKKCYEHAAKNGIIIADTKFEFGLDENGDLVLADEVLTPDSSRFWDAEKYRVGESPESFDKQFVRDYLTKNNLAGKSDIKEIPAEIVAKTAAIYKECERRILGK